MCWTRGLRLGDASALTPISFVQLPVVAVFGYELRTALVPAQWNIRACQCAFCRAHAALSCSDPNGTLAFVERETGVLARYRFGLKTADFLLCMRCGVYNGATIETPDGRFG